MASLLANVVVRIEFDGFMRIDVSLTPYKPATRHLSGSSSPCPGRVPVLRHYWPGVPVKWPDSAGDINSSGTVPAKGLALPFQPVVWLGWEEGGLSWFCETDENWRPAKTDRAIEVLPENEAVFVFRAHLFDSPLDAGIKTFSFGLQATPVKPWA